MFTTKNLCPDWQEFILQQQKLAYFSALQQNLIELKKNNIIYPAEHNYFKALELTPVSKVKIIIIGQDPYHQPNQANGLCFSVPKGVAIPPSLNNIFAALSYDLKIPKPSHGDLSYWAKQGVLLLNTVLTVSHNKPNSHKNIGWQIFTQNLLKYLTKKHHHLIFLLWGKQAQNHAKLIDNNHTKLIAPHPSPLSAYKGFIEGQHFSKTNDLLKRDYQIRWDY